jgi:hypothetical protein
MTRLMQYAQPRSSHTNKPPNGSGMGALKGEELLEFFNWLKTRKILWSAHLATATESFLPTRKRNAQKGYVMFALRNARVYMFEVRLQLIRRWRRLIWGQFF